MAHVNREPRRLGGAAPRGMAGPLPCLLCCLLWACGLGGGGAELRVESFPQSGLGPFRLLLADEAPRLEAPYVLLPPGLELSEPAAVAQGERLHLFVVAQRRGAPPFLAYSEAPRLEDGGGEPEPLLQAEAPWEGAGLRGPAVVAGVAGLPPFVLLYEAEDGSVGAAAGDDPRSLGRRPAPLWPAPAGSALRGLGALTVNDELHLLRIAEGTAIVRTRAPLAAVAAFLAGGAPPAWRSEALGLGAADFPVPRSSTERVPAERLLFLSGRTLRTPAGRLRHDLFVVAALGEREAVGAAASYDGQRFAVGVVPLLYRPGGGLRGATVLRYRERALMLLGLQTVRSGIAAALVP